ncbi:YadA-like family protein [Phascolarctobacterium sp. ET69]|uniref:YadA-like family protein n=1 Tax=Phascolarctobacterium sp. ET69 TaxID=2939420 RepID=UPI002011846D|nr:YadA-like family protein [Phascolarctobacterium sp. ET69]MCL1604447.1 YadA-like family protein [Phascolarctobacterium sp. ET69]
MAKSKKSKILAMALCASVMTGIYAAPVMAAGQVTGLKDSTGAVLTADDTVSINGVEFTVTGAGVDGTVKAAGGNFTQLTVTSGMEITGGGLTVNGETTLKNTTVGGTLTATGLASLNGGLKVTGDANLEKLNVNGKLTVDAISGVVADNLTVDTNAYVQGDLTVGNALTAGATNVSSLAVNTDKFTVDVYGNTTVGGKLAAGSGNFTVDTDGNTTIIGADKQLTVEGTAQIGTMTATTAQVGGDLTVVGETTLEKTTVNGTLTAGDTTLANTTVGGTLNVTGATTVDSLKSNGNAEVGGTLEVTGETTLKNGATVQKGLTVSGGATVDSLTSTGNATVGGTLGVTGKATFGSAENVTTIEGGTITTNTLNVETINFGNKILDKNGDDVYELSINANGSASFAKGDVTISEGGLTTFKDGDNTTTINGSEIVSDGGSLGETTINGGQVEIAQSLKVGDGFKVVGGNVWANNANIGGSADITGDATIGGQLNVTGNVTTTGNVEAVDGKFSGDVDVNGVLSAANHEFEVNSDGDVKAADATFSGTLSAAGDKFNVNGEGKATFKNSGTGYTTIDGETITSYIDSGNNGILKGNTLTLYGEGGAVTTANAGSATFTKDLGGTTIIDGGTITTGTLNVENIVLGESMTDKAGSSITVGAAGVIDIEKDENTVFHADTDNFEAHYDNYDLTLDGRNGFALSNGTNSFTLNGNGFVFAGPVNLGASDDVSYVHNGATIKLSDLTGRVEILEEKTTGISYNKDTGSTTITNTENLESRLTVGQDGTTFEGTGVGTTNINGGKVTVNGNDSTVTTIDGSEIVSDATASSTVTGGAGAGTGTVNGGYAEFDKGEGDKTIVDGGNVNVSNKITVGTGTTEITGDHVIVGVHDANKSNIGKGEATFDKGEDGKTIVNGGNVTTGNITADTGKIGNVEFTADGTTFEDGSENQTVIDKNGIVVGANDGTKIDKDDVSINDKNGGRIHLSDMGQVDNIDAELKQNDNYDDTVVGGINAEADIRRTEVARLDDRITKVEDRVDKVGAMSAAIANLRTMGYDPAAPTEIAVGIGQYRSETGAALGLFHYPNKDFMLSLSVSTSGDEVMGGIGATWKFGRKSAEEVEAAEAKKAEKARIKKAEKMRKAAKEAKVKAQQERHAKMAAEMKK